MFITRVLIYNENVFKATKEELHMNINLLGLSDEQWVAAQEVSELLNFNTSESGQEIKFEKAEFGIQIVHDGISTVVKYGENSQMLRALGLAIEGLRKEKPFVVQEQPQYEQLSVMIDCSRNAVLHFNGYKHMMRSLALMGYTSVQLYTEDTFEIESSPYFGYLRGRYTANQLREMDAYAEMLGIELVPCIQTLAHLGTFLKWKASEHLKDVNDILLIEEPKVYELINDMFKTMSSNIKSRRINIGMDEAHMLGLGKYLEKHGFQERSSIMLKHFNKVVEIARHYNYEPMMWSDMFFRLASGGQYYDPNSPIKEEIIELIPNDISLIYWDYYSENKELYDQMMKKHKQLNDNIIFAGGAWKWMGFAPNNHFSNHISVLAHESCKENKIKEVVITAWGDDGGECSLFSILPALQQWAELCYKDSHESLLLAERFETCTGGQFDDFMKLDLLNLVPDNPAPGKMMGNQVNPGKYLLYQDILYGLFDLHISKDAYVTHYRQSALELEEASNRNPAWSHIFNTQSALCKVLEIKVAAGIEIRQAYQNSDMDKLTQYAEVVLPELKIRLLHFINLYRTQWQFENKIMGLDMFDIRTGGLLQRINTAIFRLGQYISKEVEVLEELEHSLLYYDGREDGEDKLISTAQWHQIASPSVMTGI